ncbi:exported hypothetical protein [Paraburkholderia ribeironis]|uniref:Uncharacterized protein n=1 Tax=Paraburkholderia ribeironis TaxID=1247936 RepID=A0A1N7S908_9BURK|nr:exported hypothetical protein [Paraburkholderia ribeironis]
MVSEATSSAAAAVSCHALPYQTLSLMKNPVLAISSYRYFFLSRIAMTMSNQMLMVIVAWQMYDWARCPLYCWAARAP